MDDNGIIVAVSTGSKSLVNLNIVYTKDALSVDIDLEVLMKSTNGADRSRVRTAKSMIKDLPVDRLKADVLLRALAVARKEFKDFV